MEWLIVESFQKIEEKTPEDTFELKKKNKMQLPRMEWTHMVARVTNDDEKWVYVEYGHEPKEYNYYKNSWRRKWWEPFYSWVGARMFSRTKKEMESTIRKTLKP